MTGKRFSIDTNILIYSLDQESKKKHVQSIKIIKKMLMKNCVLTLQSLSEFYYASTRKKILEPEIALEQIEDWATLFPVIHAKSSTLTKGITLSKKHHLSFWDSMLLATAKEADVNYLISEDFNHHQTIEGIKIINPFLNQNFDDV